MPRAVLLALLTLTVTPVSSYAQSPWFATKFQFREASPPAVRQLFTNVADCVSDSPAFRQILLAIPDSHPLPAKIVDSSTSILFAGTSDPESGEPLLIVDLPDLQMLPTTVAVRKWHKDSSWAFTRCELLAHELAETLEYRAVFESRPAGETPRESDALFGSRKRIGHLKGLDSEGEVASDLKTRVDSSGAGYRRSRECFADGAVHMVFRGNTETLLLGPDPIPRVIYFPGRDMCVGP